MTTGTRSRVKRAAYYGASLLIVFSAGGICGRAFLPRVVERTVYSEARAEGKADTQRQTAASSEAVGWADQADTRTTDRAFRPDGTLETERIAERSTGSRAWRIRGEEATREAAHVETKTVEVVKQTERIVDRPVTLRPTWSVAAGAGWDLARGRAVYLGSVERRILGPVAAGVWVTSSQAAGLYVRISF